MILPCLYIAPTGEMGRGVFTSEPIAKHEVVEISPVLVMNASDREHLERTRLHDYIFEWGEFDVCMALGYIPMYNHSYSSNCDYHMDYDDDTITIITMRDIEAGEELFINYNGAWDDDKPIWFDAK